jgi:transcriptional regulator with XRE-family HTH domain
VLTTGIPALDDLLDDVRVGDNLVLLAGPGVPLDVIGRRFVEAVVTPGPLVVAATEERAVRSAPTGARLLDRRAVGDGVREDAGVGALVAALAEADEEVGEGASYLIDSLSEVQRRWGPDAALELFLAICPRLYRRRSVAMWLLDADQHDRSFLERLREITQVVVELSRDGEQIVAEVLEAAGRAPTTLGRRLRLALEGDELVAAGPVASARERMGSLVRSQRTIRGLSQAELARRIGISPSALSQVERGVRGLSAESLIRIWEVLGVPFGPEDTLQRGYRIARRSAHRVEALAGGVRGRQLYDDPAAGSGWVLEIDPHAAGRQLFSGKSAEVVLVRRGVLDVEVGGHTETLHEGDTLVATKAAVGSWRNPGAGDAEVFWCVLP